MVIDGHMLEELRQHSREFRTLESRHRQLETELAELIRHRVLTPLEELHKRELQKQKLAAKDRMAQLIREHERAEAPADRLRAVSTAPPQASERTHARHRMA
ncbi:MAG: YdcH family protein [Nitrospirota bacterium]